jgi:hypothetical protein
MNRTIPRLTVAGLLIAAVAFAPVASRAQDKKTNNASGSKVEEKPARSQRAVPFRGKITAIDKGAMTLTIGKRIFHITSETKITKDDQPATLADGVVGEAVTGNYLKGADGKLSAKTVHLDPKPAKDKKPVKKEKAEAKE